MAQHTLKRFDEELTRLKEHVITMGTHVEVAIANAIKAVAAHDAALATQTIEADTAINAMEVQCDEMTRSILVRHQPAANDLRFIIAIIKVVTDLERMGDLAAGICEGVLEMRELPPQKMGNLEMMGEKVRKQVNRALDALARSDVELAMAVLSKDKTVDSIYKGIYRESLTYMMEDPRAITGSIVQTNIAKGLERIADHATNIAEMVIYIVHGHDVRHVDHKAAARLLNSH